MSWTESKRAPSQFVPSQDLRRIHKKRRSPKTTPFGIYQPSPMWDRLAYISARLFAASRPLRSASMSNVTFRVIDFASSHKSGNVNEDVLGTTIGRDRTKTVNGVVLSQHDLDHQCIFSHSGIRRNIAGEYPPYPRSRERRSGHSTTAKTRVRSTIIPT